MVHSMRRGIDCLFFVSDDSDFSDMLRRSREENLGTVVVGDWDRALGRHADLWMPWMGLRMGSTHYSNASPSLQSHRFLSHSLPPFFPVLLPWNLLFSDHRRRRLILPLRRGTGVPNWAGCPVSSTHTAIPSCDPSLVHIAMTLDSSYLRGPIATVHSVLRHSSCSESVFFHFVAAEFDPASPRVLTRLILSIFPSLNFKVYIFKEDTVINLISSSIRLALENPLRSSRTTLYSLTCSLLESLFISTLE
ncbi:galacturonosyltransferase-like 8 [Vigna angularis]|uniref:Galacturonosyltransferase-like 8 n=1 Tax=Phaseolus angularis TaxID=3914 RepID=A0A8T0LAR6_PHAAN|nr:galacturonosyltransferase-like 8 [Vigna angularis]